jgi:L-lysine exporter family protein LysE/ArgO
VDLIVSFIKGFLFSLSVCFDLGIVNVAIMKAGVERGIKPAFMIGFGSCFGDMFYLSLALLGVSFIFDITAVRWTLWIAGSAVLLYLALRMARESWRPTPLNTDGIQPARRRSAAKDFATGAVLTMASPTVIAWFAFAAAPIVAGMGMTFGPTLLVFISGFFFAGLLWSLALALVSGLSGALFGTTMIRVLSLISALLFLYFAFHVFMNGLKNL